MIILEGMDNSGKTTLAQRLLEEFSELRITKSCGHASVPDALAWVAQAIRNEDPRMVYDRYFPISERVYGPILRHADIFGSYTFDILSLTFRREPLIIYCRPPLFNISNWGERDQMNGVKDRLVELSERYDWLMDLIREMYLNSALVVNYDYTNEKGYTRVSSAVRMYLKTHRMILPIRREEHHVNIGQTAGEDRG